VEIESPCVLCVLGLICPSVARKTSIRFQIENKVVLYNISMEMKVTGKRPKSF
jgi:hypothetical protein